MGILDSVLKRVRMPSPIQTGLLVLLASVVGVAFVLIGLDNSAFTQFEARLWIGILGIFATIGLAMGIYIQAQQNTDLIDQTKAQTIIIQESELMPKVTFNHEGKQFIFRENPPFNPEIKIISNGHVDRDGWLDLEVSAAVEPWIVGVGNVFRTSDVLDDGNIVLELHLRFESITGECYEYQYEIEGQKTNDDVELTDSSLKNRILPWRDEKG